MSKRKFLSSLLVITNLILFIGVIYSQETLTPPVAKKIEHRTKINDTELVDNYFWLRDKADTDVMEYLKAENAYADSVMKDTEKFQEKLFQEMVGRIKETDLTVPYKKGEYYYYTRTEKGKQYSIYCRKKDLNSSEEQILLDVNELAKDHDFCDIGVLEVSPNGDLLAYSVDYNGSEEYTLYVKDLLKNANLAEEIKAVQTTKWANENKTLFYTVINEAKRPYKLYRHVLGTGVDSDKLIYEETDEKFSIALSKTRTKSFIILSSQSNMTSENHYLDANTPEGSFQCIQKREQGVEYYLEHYKDKFYILTNFEAKNFRLMEVSIKDTSKKNWVEVIPYNKEIYTENLDAFKNHLVLYERDKGLQKIHIINLTTNEHHYVSFQDPTYSIYPGANYEFDTDTLRFTYNSLITPQTVYDYNMDTKEKTIKKQQEVKGYVPEEYQSERIFAKAEDNTLIPISMVYKKGMKQDGKNPVYLDGYGAYGIPEDPYFSSNRLSLLNRGFIFAIAHIRGGGELGREWYENGKLLNKKNTFTDFISSAKHLINEKYTSSDKLVIDGGSAGGLLMGAVLNMEPSLFYVAVADVPFVDTLNTMLDASLPLTVEEYEEWGNPQEKNYFDYIRSYSPYDNVKAQKYPIMLVTAGLNDPRVSYWEPAKWVAKLRSLKTDNNILILKTNLGTGHLGSSGRYDFIKDIAFEYAFILKIFGILD